MMMATMATADKRPPKLFIINGHGSSVIDKKTQTPVVMDSLVDTFTTAKIGFPLITFPMSIGKTTTFNDDAYTWFKYQLHKNLSSRDVVTKDDYRDVILRSLCETRDTGRDPIRPHVLDWRCKFRCHELHKQITDMYLFHDGSPVNERILEFDMVTGDMDDVEHMFGLQEKSADKIETTPSGLPPREKTPEIMEGIRQYEAGIAYLEDLLKTTPRSNIRNLKKEIKTKRKELEMHHLRLSKLNKRSKFEYNESLQEEYGSEPIKLSVILRTAIKNGTIYPETDFVVVFACRVPSMNVEGLESPRDSDEVGSVGGFSRSKKRKPRKQSKRKLRKQSKRKPRKQSKRKQSRKSH
jgi:hypothetical protein